MNFDLAESIGFLERTPQVLNTLLRGMPGSWQMLREGPERWNPLEVVGHLIHGEETDWIPRATIILEHGDGREFEPFDRFAQMKRFSDWTLDRLLDRFEELRRTNLETLRDWGLSEEQLDRPGRHPELGAVNLRQLLATWVVHDFNHLAQISRVLAKAYTEEVGVWREYLPVLNN